MQSLDHTPGRSRVVILGNDALLAARPATPVQVARACLAAGYAFVAPVSWGEELIAEHAADFAGTAPPGASVLVHCPYVAASLGEAQALPCCVSVSPPIATARYVRAAFAPRDLQITYVGRCPGAKSDEIDEHLPVEMLLARLVKAGYPPLHEPDHFDDVVPPDRGRYASAPGGAPDAGWLQMTAGAGTRDVTPETLMTVARAFTPNERVFLDLATAAGCHCARDSHAIQRLEPARSSAPVVSRELEVDLTPTPQPPLEAPLAVPREFPTTDAADEASEYWLVEERPAPRPIASEPAASPPPPATIAPPATWWRAGSEPRPPERRPELTPAPEASLAEVGGVDQRHDAVAGPDAHPAQPPVERERRIAAASEAPRQPQLAEPRAFVRRPVAARPAVTPDIHHPSLTRLGQRLPGRERGALITHPPPDATAPQDSSTSVDPRT